MHAEKMLNKLVRSIFKILKKFPQKGNFAKSCKNNRNCFAVILYLFPTHSFEQKTQYNCILAEKTCQNWLKIEFIQI